MKIAISATGKTPESSFNPRFGRCDHFLIYDQDAKAWEAHPNPALSAQGGAGTQAAQLIAGLGVQAVISGRFGPNAFTALEAGGIQCYLAKAGSVQAVIEQYQTGQLESVAAATGPELHHRKGGRAR